jgi:hypothetical protein
MTRGPEWLIGAADKRLHDLGDSMHVQVTAFDGSHPLLPGRYWFGVDTDDRVVCVDIEAKPRRVVRMTATDETRWVIDRIRETVGIASRKPCV